VIGFSLFTALIAFVVVWLNMVLTSAIASIWLDSEKAKIAGFAFVLGTFVAADKQFFGDDGIGLMVGGTLGFISVWWFHFAKKRQGVAHG
jgi:hypothetical protein